MLSSQLVYDTYDAMVSAPVWRRQLALLNSRLRDALSAAGAPECLSGNLFYDHLQPRFWEAELLADCDAKRRRLFTLAQQATNYFEVGVNGGHSLFLALSANPALVCTGVDLCKRMSPKWGAVDVYVEVAAEWLKEVSPGRVTFLKGDSLTEIPRFIASYQGGSIDLVHVDGDKRTYLQDVRNLWSRLAPDARVIFDDTDIPLCRQMVQAVLDSGYAVIDPEFPDFGHQKYQHSVVRVRKSGPRS